jgi:hypothetical protein
MFQIVRADDGVALTAMRFNLGGKTLWRHDDIMIGMEVRRADMVMIGNVQADINYVRTLFLGPSGRIATTSNVEHDGFTWHLLQKRNLASAAQRSFCGIFQGSKMRHVATNRRLGL